MLSSELYQLLGALSFKGRLNPEAALQKSFIDELRHLSINKRLGCVWASIPNENSSNKSPVYGAMLRATGKIPGAPDMLFMWDEGCGFIEFKSGKNKQTEKQKLFEKWCKSCNVKYEISYSKDDAINILTKWGVING